MKDHSIIKEVKACRVCVNFLPSGPNPIFSFSSSASILIIGQAPGAKVHASGIPWNDQSGKLLREWMMINDEIFYDEKKIALLPMGFCYPGKGSSGDLPPRPECAPLWHHILLGYMKQIRLTVLIGQYSQNYYLGDTACDTLTETVRSFKKYLPEYLPLPHPSPRNRIWLKRNPWFDTELIPVLRKKVKAALKPGK
ncbi:MAG TPA: uracil-DNA glycosylase family protein [Chitinophagaceae bacterium]|nr:uracil-DNA glycosylase family protein [Chitinophagaceae bacterium]